MFQRRLGIALGLFLAAAGCAQHAGERLLATIPADVTIIVPPAFSRDGRHACFVARAGGTDRVMRGDRSGPAYELI